MTDQPTPAPASLRDQYALALEREDALHCGYDHGFASTYGVDPETDGFVDAVLAVRDRRTEQLTAARDELADILAAVLSAFPTDLNPGGPAVPSRRLPAELVARWRDRLTALRPHETATRGRSGANGGPTREAAAETPGEEHTGADGYDGPSVQECREADDAHWNTKYAEATE